MLMIKGIAGGLIQPILFAALLLIPAGTWHWPRAIQFVSAYTIVLLVSIVLMARFAPSSLEARLEMPGAKSQPLADRIITFLLILAMLAWFAFVPVDVFRLQLFPPPSLALSILGAVLGFTGYGIMILALFQNAFAVPVAREQPERGQVLIDTGLYGLVRHPMYLGILVFFIGVALWLESYASLLSLSLVFLLLVARIYIEEKTLREGLTGYIGYMERVRYRLVPFVW